jgi:CubicO group peptidase (beta-lactamase class C family)
MISRIAFSALLFAAAANAEPAISLPRSTPEEQGVSSAALLGFFKAAGEKIDAVHSVMIVRHGHVIAEGWWDPYAAAEPHMLFSLSKSFTSTAVGLAVAEGKLSLDGRVMDFFPDAAPAMPSKNLQQMRVRDLLRMSSGQRAADINDFPFVGTQDPIRAFLEIPVPDIPGTHFVYNTPASFVLSAIVQKVTGQTVLDYLGPRLFVPLGITDAAWDTGTGGVSLGGFGLSLRTEDIAKFGQLYLQRGEWNGRQVIPSAWVDEATAVQTANGSDPSSDWNQGYGYQFWRARHGVYRGDGAFGQFCLVIPKSDTVIAITSGTGDMPAVMNLVWDLVLPALGDGPLAPDPAGDQRLKDTLSSLRLPTEEGAATSASATRFGGRMYTLLKNPQGIESVRLDISGAVPVVALKVDGVVQTVPCGYGTWAKGSFRDANGKEVPIAASGAWSSDDTFTFKVWRYRTPFATTYDLRFSPAGVIVESLDNVGLGSRPTWVRAVGSAVP